MSINFHVPPYSNKDITCSLPRHSVKASTQNSINHFHNVIVPTKKIYFKMTLFFPFMIILNILTTDFSSTVTYSWDWWQTCNRFIQQNPFYFILFFSFNLFSQNRNIPNAPFPVSSSLTFLLTVRFHQSSITHHSTLHYHFFFYHALLYVFLQFC